MENYKYYSGKFERMWINGDICHSHGLEDLVLVKCQFYQKLSIGST